MVFVFIKVKKEHRKPAFIDLILSNREELVEEEIAVGNFCGSDGVIWDSRYYRMRNCSKVEHATIDFSTANFNSSEKGELLCIEISRSQ